LTGRQSGKGGLFHKGP